jgi:hypothetical protein
MYIQLYNELTNLPPIKSLEDVHLIAEKLHVRWLTFLPDILICFKLGTW